MRFGAGQLACAKPSRRMGAARLGDRVLRDAIAVELAQTA
jgi:hypothetical protein